MKAAAGEVVAFSGAGVSEPCCKGAGTDAAAFHEFFHVAFASTKDEDVSIVRAASHSPSGMSLYAVADGHNGSAAARQAGLLLPAELERQLGGGAAPAGDSDVRRALARSFLAVDEAVCRQFVQSGCTLSAAVLCGDVLTIANVGDSRAILDTGAEVVELTTDHRIGQNSSEFARLEQAGGRLARLNEYGAGPSRGAHEGVGPVRLWPGGVMVGRGIGDRDVGEILLPHPHIRQVRLPAEGARLIIASDGLWDSMPAGRVARVLRGHSSARSAATQAVASVAACRGGFFADDVTVIVVDILPRGTSDFRQVCARYGGRLRTALSSPHLSSLSEERRPQSAPAPALVPRRGLFSCFAKPAVVGDDGAADVPAKPPPAPHFTPASSVNGRHLNPSASLRGGSERSMRGGIARDPSVRGCKRATTLELLCDIDTASWTAADFGRPAAEARRACSRSSSGSVGPPSPRGVLGGLPLGPSLSSLTSEDDLPRLALSRRNSLALTTEKKCHGSNAAAALLNHA